MHYDAVIGTYSEHGSEGIYSCDVTIDESISVEHRFVTCHREHPTFLALHSDEPILYAVHEVETGQVSAYRVEDDGSLTLANRQPTGAAGPCYCSVHPSGEYLFTAQYTGGAVSMLPIRNDGTVGEPVDVVEHEGSGPNPDRQEGPHPHAAVPSPDGAYLYVPDLGTDEVVTYEVGATEDSLVRSDAVTVESGAGPRHLAFHPERPLAYLITELASTIVTYEWVPETGELDEIGTTTTLPSEFDGSNQTSEIAVHPSGEWLYGANRGHDSIARATIDDDGVASFVETVPTGGAWPRYFGIDPAGEALFVQNRESDDVVPFRIDRDEGALTEVAGSLEVPAPSCLVFRE